MLVGTAPARRQVAGPGKMQPLLHITGSMMTRRDFAPVALQDARATSSRSFQGAITRSPAVLAAWPCCRGPASGAAGAGGASGG